MTPNGQIAIPLDKAAIREPFLSGLDSNSRHWRVRSEFNLCPQFTSSRPAQRRSAIADSGQRLWVRSGLAAVIHVDVSAP
jgi:hypothetical protein